MTCCNAAIDLHRAVVAAPKKLTFRRIHVVFTAFPDKLETPVPFHLAMLHCSAPIPTRMAPRRPRSTDVPLTGTAGGDVHLCIASQVE